MELNTETNTIGTRIKMRREQLDMTQDELAKALGYKSRSSINKIEVGASELTQKAIQAIAEVLQTTPYYIMGWNEQTPTKPITFTNDQIIELVKAISVCQHSRLQYIFEILKQFGIDFDLEIEPELTTSRNSPYAQNFKKKKSVEERQEIASAETLKAFEAIAKNNVCSVNNLATFLGVDPKTVRRRVSFCPELYVEQSIVIRVMDE